MSFARSLVHVLVPRLWLSVLLPTCFVAPSSSAAPASVRPVELLCENLKDPLGLDLPNPRLTWQLQANRPEERGQGTTAYEVRVGSTIAALSANQPDLWRSGWQTDSATSHTRYAGRNLSCGDQAFWQVRVKDENNRTSEWSEIGRWSVGPLAPEDWTGHWIGSDQVFERGQGWPPPDNTVPDPWLRRTFDLPREPRRAMLYVASVGYHEVYVNGKRLGDTALNPCVSDYSQRARYVTYDLTTHLRPGRNALGLWLGTSWSIFPPMQHPSRPATPIAIAQAEFELADDHTVTLVTDSSWKTHPSPNTLLGVWDFMHFGGELYDAQRDLPDWCSPDLDDSSWTNATTYQPQLRISAAKVEPNRSVKEWPAAAIEEVWPGTWRIDMGVNFAGWVEFPVKAKPGSRLEILWSERPDQEMTHRLRSVYLVGPSGEGVWRNRFNYGSGRWITVQGGAQKPSAADVRGWLIRTDYPRTTTFRCSNPLLNQIYDLVLWTFENLSLGGYVVDCPQRERMGYGGDAHATTETALDNYRMAAFYTKWAEDWRDVQGKEAAWGVGVAQGQPGAGGDSPNTGNLPYTAPTYWGGGGPAWSGYCVTLPWELFRRYGDPQIIEANFTTIGRWLSFLETKSSKDLLQRWGGQWDFLGDWLWPGAEGVNGDTRETLFFNNCYWIYNLETAARLADALGRPDSALAWRARAHRVRRAVHQEFYQPEDASYVDGSQACLAIALLAQVPPLEVRPRVETRLEREITTNRNGHFWAGITGGYFLVKQLIENDRPDLLYLMLTQPDYPGWAHMIQQGATTAWEDWEGKLSLLHSSYLHVGSWFIQGLAGIRPGPDGRAFRQFELRPGIWTNCPIDFVETRMESPRGLVESSWQRDKLDWVFRLQVPPGTSARFHLPPALGYRAITENGRPLERIDGIRDPRSDEGRNWTLTLEPGRYELRASPATPIVPQPRPYIPGHL